MVERPVAVVHGALETNLLGAWRLARALIPLLVTFTVTQPGCFHQRSPSTICPPS